ncbi:uncharacterized protein LOC117341901 [Pecten maximus]|uniref:uncharacterized protein LOC117341901 n=1 Tax=Pecten maximus TaxID=6579 RepID=UPI001458FF0F|nr:uncharacterized protein LOC117341901 [Pecten maximus]
MMNAAEIEWMSVLLSIYLERTTTGTKQILNFRKRAMVLNERLVDSDFTDYILTGSIAQGCFQKGSDVDTMLVNKSTEVLYPDQSIPQYLIHKTILNIREAGCRPGFVHLALRQLSSHSRISSSSLVRIGDSVFISSDIFREEWTTFYSKFTGSNFKSSGPSSAYTSYSGSDAGDFVFCFPCKIWPSEANEWITRTRLHGWPHQTLIDEIVNSGCHLVPVGDKCSKDTFLQWRISFTAAERSLVHSFRLIQVKVYVLLKYFLKQIKETLKEIIGDDDILCTYFLKTIMFHAIENSSHFFWQDKNLFYCFWFCINILIAWVRAGFCPNYFFPNNNMFQRKIHGQHQQILLDILVNYSQMKWMCLSVGNFFKNSIWERLCDSGVQAQLVLPMPAQEHIMVQDLEIVSTLSSRCCRTEEKIINAFRLLSTSKSEFEEVFAYHCAMSSLRYLSSDMFSQEQCENRAALGNKTRYGRLRKCKYWITRNALMRTDVLYLATLHFLTGNFPKCLGMSRRVMKLASYIGEDAKINQEFRTLYRQPHGYIFERLHQIYSSFIKFRHQDMYLPHLSVELSKEFQSISIPPLPYTLFMNFLCCHELGDTRGRDGALHQLVQIQYHEEQGGQQFWIVHTLLGICYQTLGDYQRAIEAYWESAQSKGELHEFNTAKDRIAIVYLCMYVSRRSDSG